MSKAFIRIGGAREHNLKNLTLSIPRDKLVVITGLSGSGKSSLAFDTIYAEGQRKYVESLSAYARQFLDQMQKPDVDFIEGLSPAIAIEQRSSGSSPRSIIATTTEIYDYLRLLYAHVGQPYCPETGVPIVRQTTSDIVDRILALPPRTRVMLLAPVVRGQKGEFRDVVERLAREGFVRARVDGELVELASGVRIKLDPKARHTIEAVVDRLVIDEKIRVRLSDSVETALRWGEGVLLTLHQLPSAECGMRSAESATPHSALRTPHSVAPSAWIETLHSNRNLSPATGKSYEPLTPKHFSFNAPAGACPVCHGLGQKLVFDEGLVVPDPEKSLEQGAILPWRRGGKRMVVYYRGLLRGVAKHYQQSMDAPYQALPADFRRALLWGTGQTEIEFNFWRAGKISKVTRPFEGVIPNLQRLYQESESEFTRNRLKGFMSPQFCDACRGRRLKPEILAVTLGDMEAAGRFKAIFPLTPALSLGEREERRPRPEESAAPRLGEDRAIVPPLPQGEGRGENLPNYRFAPCPPEPLTRPKGHPLPLGGGEGRGEGVVRNAEVRGEGEQAVQESTRVPMPGLSIMDVCALSVERADEFFATLKLTEFQEKVAHDLIKEIRARLGFLRNVGLGYLTLDRESGTLSGGEAQRIRLATQIGAGLVGVLYILDEPSIGLHQRDNDRLLRTLAGLRDLGNSVLVVEHDADTIGHADYILDLGPGAGVRGGELVAAGTLAEVLAHPHSLTAKYLRGELSIPVPRHRVKPSPDRGWLEVLGARENNLKDINARIPLGTLTCVTGVSGSGKSTLVDDILRRALFRKFFGARERPGVHRGLRGFENLDKVIVIDQTPIGRTPRSNPATYTGMFNHIRNLFARLPAAKIRGYSSGRFSFNVKGGRCEKCQGDGLIKIEMHFLPPVYVTCEACTGRRYNRETLEINYKGKNIADVLDMTVDEAVTFFRAVPQIYEPLLTLVEVGLGYIGLGQAATTLSGGEAQRVKLAAELSRKATGHTLYILDEPTTGLHFHDVAKLLEVLFKLRASGNTLIVIEHNLDVIKTADWVLDLGPEGGEAGGRIVAEGPPEVVAKCPASHTGQYLAPVLARPS
ncbi:MAG TPA: excinuclease ABC subunit UvrA [Verrucomicrobiota bacterium]|nr:excinuclease ABC subunit UvrA [Verrucomicrobiota bacterium]HQL77096.1 excinuclease ABC subunit UvrA [Verrucomicrobiota bacterium]